MRLAMIATILTLWFGQSWAIQGCLTELEDLVPKAEVVVLARITALERVKLEDCPGSAPEPGRFYVAAEIAKCGWVTRFTVVKVEQLTGQVPDQFQVLVGLAGILVPDCDDVPPVQSMQGLEVLLFLEKDAGRYWAVDGRGSLYAWPGRAGPRDYTIAAVRKLLTNSSGVK